MINLDPAFLIASVPYARLIEINPATIVFLFDTTFARRFGDKRMKLSLQRSKTYGFISM
ncbi:hypothetical protein ACVIJ6_005299 [Bradyrhizobium sp. USDA 4369]